jgi:hypothetical protein
METLTPVSEEGQDEQQALPLDRRTFSYPQERHTHIRLFLAWLPTVLQEAPGIE